MMAILDHSDLVHAGDIVRPLRYELLGIVD